MQELCGRELIFKTLLIYLFLSDMELDAAYRGSIRKVV